MTAAARPMRILHTADWHLNDRLGRIDRQPDISARLEQLAGYLEQYDVDVLLVAGDLFSAYNRADALRDALNEVNRIFQPFLLRSGTMVVMSGNHDHEATFTMLRTALDLASPIAGDRPGPRPCGRLYLAGQPTHLLLQGRGGQQVQFVLLPYPTPARYLIDEATHYSTLEERHRALQQGLTRRLERIRSVHVRPELPSVLSAHIHVRGSEVHSLYHISETEDIIFDPLDIPTHWSYVALGHIHKPQALSGAPHVRYSGSVERLDFAERHDDKGAVLVEVGLNGLVGEPRILPLDATPFYEITIADPTTEMAGLADRYPDRERALVRYSLTWKPGEQNRDELCRELENIFPRWYQRTIQIAGQEITAVSVGATGSLRDLRGTTRSYLEQRLGGLDRAAVLALADRFLDELEGAE